MYGTTRSLPIATAAAVTSSSSRSTKGHALKGRARVPGDRFVSHCALLAGLLTIGETHIIGLLETDDVLSTAEAARALGAQVDRLEPGKWRVHGVGIGTVLEPRLPLNFQASSIGAEMILGLVAGHAFQTTLLLDPRTGQTALHNALEPLKRMGLRLADREGATNALTIDGARTALPIIVDLPIASITTKAAILLAALNAPGQTTVIEQQPTADHLERILGIFGADITIEPCGPDGFGRRVTLTGQPDLVPHTLVVSADPSLAAYVIVAALITAGSDIVLEAVLMNPLRSGLITHLIAMGGAIELLHEREESGERVADLRVRSSQLMAIAVPPELGATLADDYAPLLVAAAYAHGPTLVKSLSRLQPGVRDRIMCLAKGLADAGVHCSAANGDLSIIGTGMVQGGVTIESDGDTAVAMATLILGLGAAEPITVLGSASILKRFPGFLQMMQGLGAHIG